MKGSETSSMKPVYWRTEKPLTESSETSRVKPIDWRTEKTLTKGTETSSVETVLHVRRVPAQSPPCKDGNEGHRKVFASLNDEKVQGQSHVCGQNVVGIARLKLSLPQCYQMG